MNRKIMKIIYVAVFILLLAVPGAVTVFAPSEAVGNEEKAELKDINYINAGKKFDDWFSQSFGLRNSLVNMNNSFKYAIFGQSGQDFVIAGKDGWLFYRSALHDYSGEDVMSDADIAKTARIIELMSDYVSSQGSKFVFATAPNKMEIYGEYMPYYCVEDRAEGNYEKLMKQLEDKNICYTDLKNVLRDKASESSEIIYHRLDSHWNNLGAATAFNAICDAAGYDNFDYTSLEYTVQNNFDGDLYAMLFPDGDKKDEQIVFACEQNFQYTSRFMGNDDMLIQTENTAGSGSVKMFRDSFGNALHWFFANEFAEACFTRELPYNLTDSGDYDIVVAEIVERNLSNILKYPPVMPAMVYDGKLPAQDSDAVAEVLWTDMDKYTKICIKSDDIPDECTDIFLETPDGILYTMYPQSGEYTAEAYLDNMSEEDREGCHIVYYYKSAYYRAGLLEK